MKNVINRALVAKKRNILTLVLAIVSSVWMMSEAVCITQAPSNLPTSHITVSGTIQLLDYPCEEGADCPTCRTQAIVTTDKTYYLSTSNQEVQDFLIRIESIPIPALYHLPLRAKAYGIYYTKGSYEFLEVNSLRDMYIQYYLEQYNNILSLCDEWNIIVEPFDYFSSYYTYKQQLTTDTIIDNKPAIKLQQGDQYLGALIEIGSVCYYPANGSKWYTLYDFDVKVGSILQNVWIGGNEEKYPEGGYKATVEDIKNDTIILKITCNDPDFERYMIWIKGVGMETGPVGWGCLPGDPVDPTPALLCAYKNGEQVYASYLSEKYGCEYNAGPDGPHTSTTDTIPLYARDDSGSSTVDPVDPNQIYATLTGDKLTVHNNTGAQVTFTLNNTSVNNIAARVRANTEPVSFTEFISVELSENGIYEILLTSEEWNYTVFGTVNYIRSATTITKEDPASTTKKLLRGTQILIERGDKTYTLTGQEVK